MRRTLWLILPILWLSACSSVTRNGGYYQDDGPEQRPADVSSIPDAIPRVEPRGPNGNNPYTVFGKKYYPLADARGYRERGVASWYGKKFHGKRTSSGEPYDMYTMTAAHKTLPLPCYVRVRNLDNGRSVIVRVNDRGPFLHNRLIDLSYAGAVKLGIVGTGTGAVEVEVVTPDEPAAQTPQREVISSAVAETAPASAPPKLFLQIGAFSQRDNAVSLRTRLEREALGPIVIQPLSVSSPDVQTTPVYRVRIGPLANVEEGDRLAQRLEPLGIPDALIVIEE